MFKKLHANYQNYQHKIKEPYLSQPLEVTDQEFLIKPVPIAETTNSYQIWNGYVPVCTLDNQDDCKYFPIQTANLKVSEIYEGIEVDGAYDKWMNLACNEAFNSVNEQGGPFGAVILQIDNDSNQIIRYWVNHNQVTSTNDPTAHAEIMTIRSACSTLGVFNLGVIEQEHSLLPQPGELSHCIIYSSAEPCPMCYSAICWANIPTLYFAATRFDAAAQGVNFSDEEIYDELAQPYCNRKVKVYQSTTGSSLDAFNLWKVIPKVDY